MYFENISKFLNSFVVNNQLNLFLFDELSLLNILNFKNVVVTYNSEFYKDIFAFYRGEFAVWFNSEHMGISPIYDSLVLDYYNYISNSYLTVFTANNIFDQDNLFAMSYIQLFLFDSQHYKYMESSMFNSQILSHNLWTLLVLYLAIFYFILAFLYFICNNKVSAMFKGEETYDSYNTIGSYLVESEKELGSLDDMIIGVSVLVCVYGWFFFGTIFFNFFSNISLSHLYVGFPLFLYTVLGMPTNMVMNYGIVYAIYLRGSSNTTILLLEFMYDILATGIMYIRLIVQNVRFILMFFAFFECYEFFLNCTLITSNYYFFNWNFSTMAQTYSTLAGAINCIIFYVYNVGHLMYTIVSHFFAYIVLVFWFFSFLYTTFLEEKLETYFKNLRK